MAQETNNCIEQEKLLDHKLKAALVLTACTVLCAFLYSGVTSARFKSQVEGTANIEPALFNTVLLGDLPFKAVVESLDSEGKPIKTEISETILSESIEVEDGEGNKTELIEYIGNKLTASINVKDEIMFGAVNLNNEERKLRPGSVIAIPFTVTNGTTRYADENAEKNIIGNIAETDIAYKMNLITTVNIPLEYDIYEYHTKDQYDYIKKFTNQNPEAGEDGVIPSVNGYTEYLQEINGPNLDKWGKKLTSEGNEKEPVYDELIGYSKTLTIVPHGEEETDKRQFILDREKVGESEAIDINRYFLVISWPDNLDEKKSTKYMKEIDIIEVCLEIESWTENLAESTITDVPTGSDPSTGIFRIQVSPVGSEALYFLPDGETTDIFPNVNNVYSRGTIPFAALRELKKPEPTPTPEPTPEGLDLDEPIKYYFDFMVTNVYDRSYEWTQNNETGQYEVKTKTTGLENGKAAIAVPVRGQIVDMEHDYTAGGKSKFTYELVYNGKTYVGKANGKYITTQVWDKKGEEDTEEETSDLYRFETRNAYQIIEFDGLTLDDFAADKSQEENVRLQITTSENRAVFTEKADFKILIYKAPEELPPEETLPEEVLPEETVPEE